LLLPSLGLSPSCLVNVVRQYTLRHLLVDYWDRFSEGNCHGKGCAYIGIISFFRRLKGCCGGGETDERLPQLATMLSTSHVSRLLLSKEYLMNRSLTASAVFALISWTGSPAAQEKAVAKAARLRVL
jgi:hypothetical protein